MSYRSADFPQVNRCESTSATAPTSSGKVSGVARAVLIAAMACGLSHREAVELTFATALVGVACGERPEMADELRARCYRATVGVVLAVRGAHGARGAS